MMELITSKTEWGLCMLRGLILHLIFFFGLFLMAFGISLTVVVSYLGLNPWDVLHVGLTNKLGLTIGIWNQIMGVILILITVIATKKMPRHGTFLNMIFLGVFMDLILLADFIPNPTHAIMTYIYLILGIVIMGVGTGMYIASGLGAGPRDGFMLLLCNKTGWSVRKVKTLMELVVLGIGFSLGGPVFLGTLIYSLIIGPIVQFSLRSCSKLIHQYLPIKKADPQQGVTYRTI